MVTGNSDYLHFQLAQLDSEKIDFQQFLKNFTVNFTIFINYLKDKSNFADKIEKNLY